MSIDMLEMLQERTKGNLTDPENKLIKTVLHELHLNFLQEKESNVNSDKIPEDQKAPEGQEKSPDDGGKESA